MIIKLDFNEEELFELKHLTKELNYKSECILIEQVVKEWIQFKKLKRI